MAMPDEEIVARRAARLITEKSYPEYASGWKLHEKIKKGNI
jgi:hypothetical protein